MRIQHPGTAPETRQARRAAADRAAAPAPRRHAAVHPAAGDTPGYAGPPPAARPAPQTEDRPRADFARIPVYTDTAIRAGATDAGDRAFPVGPRVIIGPVPAGARRAAQAGPTPSALAALAGAPGNGGRPIPEPARAKFERSLGADLSGVRIHDGDAAAAAARAAGARAITIGQHIHFARGQYRPATGAGERLLAHEVAHTQQRPAAPLPASPLTLTTPASTPEREAGHAAGRMITGLPTAVSPAPAGMLFCFADVPVQIELTGGLVSRAFLPSRDRPAGTLGPSEEGSHTTPWSVFTESVRQAITGKTLKDAVAAMRGLFAAAKGLPGNNSVRFMHPDNQKRYQDALAAAETAQEDASKTPSSDTLQRFISTFLEFRNMVPLTAFKRGGPANPNAESANLQVIRDYASRDPGEVRKAILGLLDVKTLNELDEQIYPEEVAGPAGRRFLPDLPGVEPDDPQEARTAIIDQHLQTMQAGFPGAYEKAGISGFDNVDKEIRELQDTVGEGGTKKGKRIGKKQESEETGPSEETGQGVSGASAVQLQLSPTGKEIIKANISKSDRPYGLFGSQDKAHSTAWIALVEGARAALEGKTIPDAVSGLDRLYTDAQALPGASLGETLTQQRRQEFDRAGTAAHTAQRAAQDAATALKTAEDDQATAQRASAESTVAAASGHPAAARPGRSAAVRPRPASVPATSVRAAASRAAEARATALDALQTYARTYLTYRNFVPLSAANLGASVAKTERKEITTVKDWRNQQPEALRAAFWGLLDASTVGAIRRGYGSHPAEKAEERRDTGKLVHKDVPGADLAATEDERTAAVIKQHLMTMRTQFQDAFDKAAFAPGHVEKYLKDKIGIPAPQAGAIARVVWAPPLG